MSRTLKLPEQLLSLGRTYLRFGQDREALRVLGKLVRLQDLPDAIAEDAQLHLAEIYHRHQKYPRARRHLNVALARNPENARYHHLMAEILEEDDSVDPKWSLYHRRRASRLDPKNHAYHCDLGLLLIAQGNEEEGLKRLRRALELAPNDVQVVRCLALNLLECRQPAEARRVALAALFRNPGNPHFRSLWNHLRFQEARLTQQQSAAEGPNKVALASVLKFLEKKPRTRSRPAAEVDPGAAPILRVDPAAAPKRPHQTRPVRKRH